MNEPRNKFDELGEHFSLSCQKDIIPDLRVLSDDILKKRIEEYIKYMSSFTNLYNVFDKNILEQIDVVSFKAYRDRALAKISVCQNQFIIPLTNEMSRRNNEKLQVKAANSIAQGDSLLIKANKSSYFAKATFGIALILSIVSLIIGHSSSKNSERILNQNTTTIDSIKFELDSVKSNIICFQDSLIKENRKIQQKLETLIKNK